MEATYDVVEVRDGSGSDSRLLGQVNNNLNEDLSDYEWLNIEFVLWNSLFTNTLLMPESGSFFCLSYKVLLNFLPNK